MGFVLSTDHLGMTTSVTVKMLTFETLLKHFVVHNNSGVE